MEFTERQLDVIRVLSDGVLPADGNTPSASQIGVNFIFADIAMSWEPDAFYGTAGALDAIADMTVSIFGKEITELVAAELSELVGLLAEIPDFKQFWEPFRVLVTLSYYALPPAFLPIGLPGPTVDKGGLTVDGFPV